MNRDGLWNTTASGTLVSIARDSVGVDNYNSSEYSNIGVTGVNYSVIRDLPSVNGNQYAEGLTRPRNVALLYCIKISTYTAPAPQTWYNTTSTASGDVALATTGDVGVGTTTPEAKLDVVGTIKITDGTQ